ncbi:MAG: sodium:proton antiporter [Candidatus Hydrogenedentota bacterium]
MDQQTLIGLTLIAVLGIGAQWLSWRVKLPSILFLLFIGFLAGVTGLLDIESLFGNLLFPVVSMSVGLILFEGGLSLKLAELRSIGKVLLSIIVVGPAVAWLLTALMGVYILGLPRDLAILLGAILIVTGPTVIIPLLNQIRPKGNVASILKWEGILIDPVGATLALLVFEAMTHHDAGGATLQISLVILKTIVIGVAFGGLGGWFLLQMLRRYWIPDNLQNPVTLMMVLAVFTASNVLQHESGLLSTTIMGILLANQHQANIHHIVEFKENLRVLLISSLFIVLAARIDLESIQDLSWTAIVFVLGLILVVRPLSILVATLGSKLTTKERLFLAWMAPRGIVAAAVSSIFAIHLSEQGYAEASVLPTITFMVIVGTVLTYGLTAKLVARKLDLAEPDPRGFLIVGASAWARAFAAELHKAEIPVLMVDSNWLAVSAARMQGLRVHYGSALSDRAKHELDLSGIGRCLALTPNEETNALISKHFENSLGRSKVFQLVSEQTEDRDAHSMSTSLRGRTLFSEDCTYDYLLDFYKQGATIKKTTLTDEFTYEQFLDTHDGQTIPLLMLHTSGSPDMFTIVDPPAPHAGHTIFSLTLNPKPSAPEE